MPVDVEVVLDVARVLLPLLSSMAITVPGSYVKNLLVSLPQHVSPPRKQQVEALYGKHLTSHVSASLAAGGRKSSISQHSEAKP